MKEIYRFIINKEKTSEKTVIKKDESGAEIKVLENVTEQIPQNYFLAKPSFTLKQESNLYYESIVAECIKRGILSTIQLRKRFVDDGGILGSEEKKTYENLWGNLWERKSELNKLNQDVETNKDAIKDCNDTILSILGSLQSIEERSGNALLYEHTAEKIASDRTSLWWMIQLSYQDIGNGKTKPVFGEGKYEDRVKVYEEMEKNEELFDVKLVQKLLLVTSLWYYSGISEQKDFDDKIKEFEDKNPQLNK